MTRITENAYDNTIAGPENDDITQNYFEELDRILDSFDEDPSSVLLGFLPPEDIPREDDNSHSGAMEIIRIVNLDLEQLSDTLNDMLLAKSIKVCILELLAGGAGLDQIHEYILKKLGQIEPEGEQLK